MKALAWGSLHYSSAHWAWAKLAKDTAACLSPGTLLSNTKKLALNQGRLTDSEPFRAEEI